jgi:hypothetical protein
MKKIIQLVFFFLYFWFTLFEINANTERWELLTSAQDIQMISEIPLEFRGKYSVFGLAKNNSEFIDVTTYNLAWNIDANSVTEPISRIRQGFLKGAFKRGVNSNPMVVLLFSDNTTLMIELYNENNKELLITGDARDASGAISIMKMQCRAIND